MLNNFDDNKSDETILSFTAGSSIRLENRDNADQAMTELNKIDSVSTTGQNVDPNIHEDFFHNWKIWMIGFLITIFVLHGIYVQSLLTHAKQAHFQTMESFIKHFSSDYKNKNIDIIPALEMVWLDAISNDNLELTEYLTRKTVDTTLFNTDGENSLHFLATKGHLVLMKRMLDNGTNISVKDERKNDALFYACENGKLSAVKLLFKYKANVNSKNNNGWTPLHIAASNGHNDIVEFLLDNKALINSKTEYDETPIFFAYLNNQVEVVRTLLKRGADIDIKDKEGYSPLDKANSKELRKVANLLKSRERDLQCDK